jgi:hypothetical protein
VTVRVSLSEVARLAESGTRAERRRAARQAIKAVNAQRKAAR